MSFNVIWVPNNSQKPIFCGSHKYNIEGTGKLYRPTHVMAGTSHPWHPSLSRLGCPTRYMEGTGKLYHPTHVTAGMSQPWRPIVTAGTYQPSHGWDIPSVTCMGWYPSPFTAGMSHPWHTSLSRLGRPSRDTHMSRLGRPNRDGWYNPS